MRYNFKPEAHYSICGIRMLNGACHAGNVLFTSTVSITTYVAEQVSIDDYAQNGGPRAV